MRMEPSKQTAPRHCRRFPEESRHLRPLRHHRLLWYRLPSWSWISGQNQLLLQIILLNELQLSASEQVTLHLNTTAKSNLN